ncbi:MAG: IS1 family transposase [Mariprofundaceae bacterium]|nr:IS1 family transposase [Mariprofundaceae bacterium]
MAHLNTPISKVSSVFRIRSEGMALRACARVFDMNKSTITKWEVKFSKQKEPLMLYGLCHKFISLTFEGDELYTVVNKRGEAYDSEGWTAVIMDRSSCFIVEQRCGKKDQEMFENIMKTVVEYISNSQDFTFLSDGERRYGNTIFDLCARELRRGLRGRPPKTLPKGVKVRIKNKGSQAHKRGPKRPKYEAPKREHPDTSQTLNSSDIHANHVEAQNGSLRRRNSAFIRRTNTYAKNKEALQRTLDVHQIIHVCTQPLDNWCRSFCGFGHH